MSKINSIADYFINLSTLGENGITHWKLQRLIYYAQEFSLIYRGEVLFEDNIYLTERGPTVFEISQKYGGLKHNSIPFKLVDELDLNYDEQTILNRVWKQYGNINAKYLYELVMQGDPCLYTEKSRVIEVDMIKKYINENTKNS